MKRSGVRTRTLGLAWEERFLAAVRKAREQKLIAAEQAEKLRLLAGVYFCVKCQKEHRTESEQGRAHLRLQPKAPEEPAKGPRKQATLAGHLVAGAREAGASAKAAPPKRDKARRKR